LNRHPTAWLLRGSYAGLLLWQIAWHGLLPRPHGSTNWLLAVVACLPLLPALPAVVKTRPRGMMLGAFVVTVYFIVGVMEAWSNPAQRAAAMVQVFLGAAYCAGVAWFSRSRAP